MGEINSQDLFDKWQAYLRDEGTSRYMNNVRMDHLNVLVEMFFNGNVDHDEVKSFKKKVLLALTHEEGRKGNGKYKGWKEWVETDFDSCVANWYVKAPEAKDEDNKITKGKTYTVEDLLPDDPDIRKWLIDKYGDKCTEALIQDAHTIGNMLNIQYLSDRFD